jgi:alpha-D-ribose 1-methylphosphonate 5-triphosphate diphosphatase
MSLGSLKPHDWMTEYIAMAAVANRLLTNARVVLGDRVIEQGWVAVTDGVIVEIGEGSAPERGEEFGGDLLLPGLIELHTDHVEAHLVPRPKVYWDPVAAVISYDGQIAVSGITTVLDSLRVWREEGAEDVDGQAVTLAAAIAAAREAGCLRVDHWLHLRCEVPMPGVVAEASELIGRTDVRLVSLMDHTPGQRQFRDPEKLRAYYRGKTGGMSDAELDILFAKRLEYQAAYAATNYRSLVAMAQSHGIPLASHDDTTLEHVDEAIRDNVAIAEFPTTVDAAAALHAAGVRVLMGAPNLVRGKSHAGNVPTVDLAQAGVLDVLSSDYMPSSLLLAALRLPRVAPTIDLPAAVRTVTKTPAEAVGLMDRGEILPGKRADIIRVRVADDIAAVRSVWSGGRRVA